MRYIIFAAIVLSSCGDGPPVVPDLAAAPMVDLAQLPAVDQAQVVPDMAQPPPPPACSAPKPGVYKDVLQLTNLNVIGSAQAITTTIIYNDGTLRRPSPTIPTPFEYHCDFTEKSIDQDSCMAPCCAGQPGTPIFYFDSAGWVLVTLGVCTFQTTSATSYNATIVDGAGTLVH